MMGTYARLEGQTNGGRAMYRRAVASVAFLLMYFASAGEWGIGAQDASNAVDASFRSINGSGALCPDQVAGWQALVGGVWVTAHSITVAADVPSIMIGSWQWSCTTHCSDTGADCILGFSVAANTGM